MSATGEDRWRNRGQQNSPLQNQNPNPNQNPNSKQNQQQQPNQQRQQTSRFASGPPHPKQNTADLGDGAVHGPPQDQHVPVRGFNSSEVREALKKAYDSGATEAGKSVKHKPVGGQTNNAKSGGPWGAKANTTANGKDFFLELRKQFSTLQQGEGERAGG